MKAPLLYIVYINYVDRQYFFTDIQTLYKTYQCSAAYQGRI